jgi:hypothetical protein
MAASNYPILSFTVDRLISRIEFLARTHRMIFDNNILFREIVDNIGSDVFIDNARGALLFFTDSTISY